MSKTTRKRQPASGEVDLGGGFLNGLTNLIEKLGELAEKGEQLHGLKEFGKDELKGVYGFTIRTGLGGSEGGTGLKVQPFGNVRTDKKTGRATVHEVIEPPVDIFEEPGHVSVIVELPGVGPDDLSLELADDILTIKAERNKKKYQKEILLPAAFTAEQMTHTCRNGILEIRFQR
ncbi:MAG TPA: Hsp20/alpha crystallin family protein [Isosphaeraceae bacterium]|nr:Hsp20/alpha crystallin family protein [Isosphaeraceae bacterium]